MNGDKVEKFMILAGQIVAREINCGDEKKRVLGASLLLSEVLEYVIKGLGVTPEVNGVKITSPDSLTYKASESPHVIEMLDGLSDVAYTMYWNALAFGLPLDAAFDLVCDNNLEKFVPLGDWGKGRKELSRDEWGCGQEIEWPSDVVRVAVIPVAKEFFAVGLDARGKVRKPSTYKPVNLSPLCERQEPTGAARKEGVLSALG